MCKKEIKVYVFFILLCELVGGLSSMVSMLIGGWNAMSLVGVQQSGLTPPGIIFLKFIDMISLTMEFFPL